MTPDRFDFLFRRAVHACVGSHDAFADVSWRSAHWRTPYTWGTHALSQQAKSWRREPPELARDVVAVIMQQDPLVEANADHNGGVFVRHRAATSERVANTIAARGVTYGLRHATLNGQQPGCLTTHGGRHSALAVDTAHAQAHHKCVAQLDLASQGIVPRWAPATTFMIPELAPWHASPLLQLALLATKNPPTIAALDGMLADQSVNASHYQALLATQHASRWRRHAQRCDKPNTNKPHSAPPQRDQLVQTLADFPLITAQAHRQTNPQVLLAYLQEVNLAIRAYRQQQPRIVNIDEKPLSAAAHTVLSNGLRLLGIPPIGRM